MFARYLTPEALLLLVLGLGLLGGGALALHLGPWVAGGLALAYLLFAFETLVARLQDRLLERDLATGHFAHGLKLAGAIRDSAHRPVKRDLAEFDVGLVHLARGAPADAVRSFGRIQKHRLQEPMRHLVALYQAIALLRAYGEAERAEAATAALAAAREALQLLGEDAPLLACEAEALQALGESGRAFDLLERSLQLDPDPRDPSPGERHLLFARAALASGHPDAALKALRIAAGLAGEPPFVRAARAELEKLAHAS